ncbi:hypothetical protein ARMSODRAFT_954584 [Armillaria solidipes]|uniref:PIN domain-like protein n=1 Tax=Armillaria solidipes TaxID=1076256 RepID=A0A2H3BLJ2_9AGAR|nr:hypothetical protein ARMSODRAFT_954584 [Armillaria solidipes]
MTPTTTTTDDWSLLEEFSKQESLTTLSLSKFDSPAKGFRLGIDVQPWFHHTNSSKKGENPRLRLLFLRCKHLLGYPILPLFMFDRNPRRHNDNHLQTEELTKGFIPIIKAFGFEWRYAPGDPLAELASLNREGIIDAVLTDDVAVWVFGAQAVWRNPSSSHPKAKYPEKQITYKVYNGVTPKHRSAIFVVLLCTRSQSRWCDTRTTLRLAKRNFSVELYKAVTTCPRNERRNVLSRWRSRLCEYLQARNPSLANHVPRGFPDLRLLIPYINSTVSSSFKDYIYAKGTSNDSEPSLPKLARICEKLFEWGWKDRILVRFHSYIWGPIAVRILRRQHLCPSLTDAEISRIFGDGGKGGKVIDKIVNSRSHPSTDETPEYRVVVDTKMLILWTEAGLKGTRQAPGVDRKGKGKEDTFDEDSEDGSDREGEDNSVEEDHDDGHQDTEPTPDVDVESDDSDDERIPEQSQQKQPGSKKGNGKKKRERKPVDPRHPLRIWIPEMVVQGAKTKLIKEYKKVREEKQKAAEKKKRKREEDDEDPHSPKKTNRSTTSPTSPKKRKVSVKKMTEARARAEGLPSLLTFPGFTKEPRQVAGPSN